MKAIGYQQSLPIDYPESLQDIVLTDPAPTGRDLLVEVKAISIKPVDAKGANYPRLRPSRRAAADRHQRHRRRRNTISR